MYTCAPILNWCCSMSKMSHVLMTSVSMEGTLQIDGASFQWRGITTPPVVSDGIHAQKSWKRDSVGIAYT